MPATAWSLSPTLWALGILELGGRCSALLLREIQVSCPQGVGGRLGVAPAKSFEEKLVQEMLGCWAVGLLVYSFGKKGTRIHGTSLDGTDLAASHPRNHEIDWHIRGHTSYHKSKAHQNLQKSTSNSKGLSFFFAFFFLWGIVWVCKKNSKKHLQNRRTPPVLGLHRPWRRRAASRCW